MAAPRGSPRQALASAHLVRPPTCGHPRTRAHTTHQASGDQHADYPQVDLILYAAKCRVHALWALREVVPPVNVNSVRQSDGRSALHIAAAEVRCRGPSSALDNPSECAVAVLGWGAVGQPGYKNTTVSGSLVQW